MRRVMAIALALAVFAPGSVSAEQSDNVSVVAREEYVGGGHLAFGGGFAYAGEINGTTGRDQDPGKGGIHIMDITGGKPREAGFFKCPGDDLDVAFVKPGVIAVGHHDALCNPFEAAEGEDDSGVFLLDVSKPSRPKMLSQINLSRDVGAVDRTGRQIHSITKYPGKPIIYINPGGLPSNGLMVTHMLDVSNPKKPKIVGEFRPPAPPTGCHDFSFHFDKRGKFGFCAGFEGTQIWEVSDPLAPEVVSTIYNPLIQFSHYAVASADGKILAINDENITVNDCVEQETPSGAIWFYDISNIESPELLSFFSPRRGGLPIGSFETDLPCTSHDFNWVDKTTAVVPFYSGGLSVISLKDPSVPEELAYYRPDDSIMWSAHYYKGRIYTNDLGRGFEVLEVKGVTD
ncbi:MAG: LVIVD repeat-containing protein [Actinomycetota bacterium]